MFCSVFHHTPVAVCASCLQDVYLLANRFLYSLFLLHFTNLCDCITDNGQHITLSLCQFHIRTTTTMMMMMTMITITTGTTAILLLQLDAPCGLRGCKNRPAPFPGRMSYRATKPCLVLFYILACFNCIVAYQIPIYVLLILVNKRRTGQPLLSDSTCQTPQAVWPRGSGGQVPGSLPCSQSMHSPKNRKRRLGRPRHTWLRTVEALADLRPFNLGLASGFKKAQDRTTWRALTGMALSPTSPE